MSRRTTKCLTWGEGRSYGYPLVNAEGKRTGYLHFVEYRTLCGKRDDAPKEAVPFDHRKPRPIGVCPACWAKFRDDMISAEAYAH
jgi:hypothetical protein